MWRYTVCRHTHACVRTPYTVHTHKHTHRQLFSELSLSPSVVNCLKEQGMDRAFEVQDQTLPLTLEGK